MAEARILSPGWTTVGDGARGVGGATTADLPRELLAEGVRIDQTFVAESAPPTRGGTPPANLDFAVDVAPTEGVVAVIRHESGALTFHLPTSSRDGVTGGEVRFSIPVRWNDDAASRGWISKAVKAIVLKIGQIAKDKVIGKAMEWLGRRLETALWDNAGRSEGWHLVTKDDLASGALPLGKPKSGARSLLLLHGTFSHAASAYKSLASSDFFERVKPLYGDRIFAFNHFSVSKTPEENARMLLAGLPAGGCTFDVVTHSRGGLVLRTLVERAKALGPEASRFKLGHAVLVASPNEGTPLANPERYEETFGWFANLLEMLPDNPFTTVAEFIANGIVWIASNVIGNLPGLQAMNEHDKQIKALQASPAPPSGKYSALAANYRPDTSTLLRLADIGIDAFFATANDLVVPSAGGWRVDGKTTGWIPAPRVGCFGSGGNLAGSAVTHVSFFSQRSTVDFLVNALNGVEQGLREIDTAAELPNIKLLRDGGIEELIGTRRVSRPAEKLTVTVVNGDLLFETNPLIVGHYESLKLTGVERLVDQHVLETVGAMSRSLELDLYPRAAGTNQIFPGGKTGEKDAWRKRVEAVIVAGLGAEGSLKTQELVETVRAAAVAWVQRVGETARARKKGPLEPISLSATLIGSGGLGITPGQSAQLIVQGIVEANEVLAEYNDKHEDHTWPRIGSVRLVELYLDRATEAWKALGACDVDDAAGYVLSGPVDQVDGALARPTSSGYRGADYDYVRIETRNEQSVKSLAFVFDTKRARTEVTSQHTQPALVQHLIARASSTSGDRGALARTLFQLLVPPDVQPMLTASAELQVELTEDTAGIPWELLSPPEDGAAPWAIRSKLLRRLKTSEFRRRVVDADREQSILVIGEPLCPENYPRLRGARAEAIEAHKQLRQTYGEKAVLLASAEDDGRRPDAEAFLTKVFERPWRVLHVAGHGRPADAKNPLAGIVLSDNLVFSAREIRAMRVVPELVFVNCCHLGQIGADKVLSDASKEPWVFDRPAFAAGVAQELINIGVRCVVAAGWAIDDKLAQLFAGTFYRQLLGGHRFIDAVHEARLAVFRKAPASTTWAAYQCYGDPDWSLRLDRGTTGTGRPNKTGQAPKCLGSIDDLNLELQTLAMYAKRKGLRDAQRHREDLEALEVAAESHGWSTAAGVPENFAEACKALRDYDGALRWYGKGAASTSGPATFKAMEQYANLLARRAWMRVRRAPGSSKRPGRSAYTEARGDIREALRILRALGDVGGSTAERHSLIGSALRRRALVEASAGNRTASRRALEEMLRAYQLALAETKRHNRRDIFYAGLNVLAAKLALAKKEPALVAECRRSIEASHAKRPTFWSFVASHDLALIVAAGRGGLAAATTRIVSDYEACFRARAGGVEWDSVYDGAEFILAPFWGKADRKTANAFLEKLGSLIREGVSKPGKGPRV